MKVIINIDVPELAPAIAFYTAALGLTHSRTLDEDVAELTGREDATCRTRLSASLDAGPFRPGRSGRRGSRGARRGGGCKTRDREYSLARLAVHQLR